MLKRYSLIGSILCGLVLPASGRAAEGAPAKGAGAEGGGTGLLIGSVSEVDTREIQRVIEGARSALAPPSVSGPGAWRLSLEEAIRISLESNLRLQIAMLDRDAADHLVPAARAKFDPVPGFDVLVSEERLVDAPEDPSEEGLEGGEVQGTQESDDQEGGLFVRQELPTAGTLTLSTDLFRESEHDPGDTCDFDDDDTPCQPGDVFEPDPIADDLYEGGVTLLLRQPLLRGGGLYVAKREIYDAEYNRDILEASLQAEILNVTAQTKEAYYNTLLRQRLIEVSQQAIERDLRLIDASNELARAGRANQRDIVSAQIRLADDQSLLAVRQGDLERSQLVLRDVLGIPIAQPVVASEPAIPFEPVEVRLGEWIERALANRPEIRQVLVRLEQSALNVRIAGNNVLPALDFLGAYRRADFDTTSRTVWGGYDSQIWEAGLHFEIPFGNVAARERLRSAKVLHERVERELRSTRRSIELEVRTEAIGLRENLDDLAAQNRKVEEARNKLEIATTRYRLGLANNLDITDAQEDLVDAESALLESIVDYGNGLARLEARIAGPL
jgi:outer membrane protein TolC